MGKFVKTTERRERLKRTPNTVKLLSSAPVVNSGNAPRKLVRFWTPIPPMDTGTAAYFELLLQRLILSGLDPGSVEIVTECALLNAPVEAFYGCAVKDWRHASPSAPNVLEIVSVANNEFHGFILGALGHDDMFNKSDVISIIHEPCCFMLSNILCHEGLFGLDAVHLARALESQYGDNGNKYLEDFKRGLIGREFDYCTIGTIEHLLKSRLIIAHSVHAFLKLFAETSVEPICFPEVLIAAHPTPQIIKPSAPFTQTGKFVVGLFGRMTDSKRVHEALQGICWYLDRVNQADVAELELLLVGSAPEGGDKDLTSAISKFGLTDFTRRITLADDKEFARLAAQCDAVIALRYPSCGESSGGLAHARGGAAIIIGSRFQAFAEELIDFAVPVPDGAAALGIADVLVQISEGALPLKSAPAPTAAPVDKILMCQIATHLYQNAVIKGEMS